MKRPDGDRILRPVTNKVNSHQSGGETSQDQGGKQHRRGGRGVEIVLQLHRVDERTHHHIHRQGRFIQRGFALELTRLAAFDKDLTNQLLQMTGILFR